MMIPIEKPTLRLVSSLGDDEELFLPYWKPRQASPYVAYYNKKGMNLQTTRTNLSGIWGTSIKRKIND